ncbi:hypothetical protein [Sphingobacterium siyangense]|uniref:hypothetical protein n=1 Tax=Sphingobacterium siyangense TaxID=459529 RepID=UPI002FDAC701
MIRSENDQRVCFGWILRDGFVIPRSIFAVSPPKRMKETDDCSVFPRGEIGQSIG